MIVQIYRDICCQRRSGNAKERREKAFKAYNKARRELYERSRPKPLEPSSVQDLSCGRLMAESRYCKGPKGRQEALTTPPTTVSVEVPKDFKPGQQVSVQGPHGPMEVDPPPNAEPGSKHFLRLAPPPEFRLGVPQGAKAGTELRFKRPDGVEVSVLVPEGFGPGDAFDTPPPSLMVRVPEGSGPGDAVVFRAPQAPQGAAAEAEWCRAVVPDGMTAGKYFAARLPAPKLLEKESSKSPAKRRTKAAAADSPTRSRGGA